MKRSEIFAFGVLIFVVGWELLSRVIGAKYFPHFWDVIATLLRTFQKLEFWADLLLTLTPFLISMSLIIVLSIILGATISSNRLVELATFDLLAFIRGVPSIVILPLLISIHGNSIITVIIAVTLSSIPKSTIFIVDGIRNVEPELLDAVAIMKLSKARKLFALYLPSGIFFSITSLKLVSLVALTSIVAAGAISGVPGLGNDLHLAEAYSKFDLIYSYVLVMGMMGLLLNHILVRVQSRIEIIA